MPDPEIEVPVETPPVVEKKFTQEDVNRIVQKEKKALEKRLDDEKSELQKQLAEIRNQLPQPTPPAEDDWQNKYKVLSRDHNSFKESMTRELDKATKLAEQERLARIEGERERVLNDALTKAKCTNFMVARKFFFNNVKWSDDAQGYLFYPDDPKEQPGSVEVGIDLNLPDFCRTAAGRPGGGTSTEGGGSGTTQKAVAQKNYEKAYAELEALWQKTRKGGNNNTAVGMYNKQKTKVAQMARDLGLLGEKDAFNPSFSLR